jgi:hypothetical protein
MESPLSRDFTCVPRAGIAPPAPLGDACRRISINWRRVAPMARRFSSTFLAPAALFACCVAAQAEPIRHPTAIFAGLDKTTGRIINFDVAIDETVQFGALQVTPRVCNTRPQTETPQTTSFVEVDEIQPKPEPRRDAKGEVKLDPKQEQKPLEARRIFSGWMFASSPGLHGVEHPVYDVWLVDCKGGKEIAAQPAAAPDAAAAAPESGRKRGKNRKVEPAAPPPIEEQPIGPADQTPAAAPAEPAAGVGVDAATAEAAAQPQKKKKKKKPKPAPAPGQAPAPAGGGGANPFGLF